MRKELRVLVVHPEPATAERIGESIREAGHHAIVVPDGERAIDRFIQGPVDAMVVELVLPGRDGGTTVESIRWAPGGDEVAVILIGTRGTPPERLDEVGRKARALAALPGPLSLAAIQSLLAGLIGPQSDAATRVAQSDEVQQYLATTREQVAPQATTAHGHRAHRADPASGWDEELYTEVDEDPSGRWHVGDDPNAAREGEQVEQQARDARSREVLEGDLSDTPFPQLLHRVAQLRGTGALVVSSTRDGRRTTTGESPKKVVYFRAGVPVYVRSNLDQECLGQVLARGGHISQRVLVESVQRMRNGEGRQGAVLVAMGALDPHQLREALEDQLRVKLFDLFAWTSGAYRFDDTAEPPAETVTLEMSLADIVLKGVVHRVPPQRLLDLLQPHLEQFVVPVPPHLEQFRAVSMAPVARRILLSLDGMQRLSELLGAAGERPGAAAQLVYSLAAVGAVELRDEPCPTPRLVERRRETPAGQDVAALREELGRLGRLLREERYAEALGVPEDDRLEALRRSEQLAARFRRVTEPGAAPRDLRALAYEVCARLVHAQKALGQPGSQAGTAVGKRVGAPDGSGSWDDIPTRDEKPIEADLRATRPAERGEVLAQIGARRRGEAAAEPWDDRTEEGEPDDLPTPRISEPPGPLSVEASVDSPSFQAGVEAAGERAREALDDRVDRMFGAERQFRRGEKALGRHRPADAVGAFGKAVELCPDEGEFVAHLGYARYQAGRERPEEIGRALEELERACELAPKLDICHLLLARVLEDLGRPADARDAWERALAANPDCGEALGGLRK